MGGHPQPKVDIQAPTRVRVIYGHLSSGLNTHIHINASHIVKNPLTSTRQHPRNTGTSHRLNTFVTPNLTDLECYGTFRMARSPRAVAEKRAQQRAAMPNDAAQSLPLPQASRANSARASDSGAPGEPCADSSDFEDFQTTLEMVYKPRPPPITINSSDSSDSSDKRPSLLIAARANAARPTPSAPPSPLQSPLESPRTGLRRERHQEKALQRAILAQSAPQRLRGVVDWSGRLLD